MMIAFRLSTLTCGSYSSYSKSWSLFSRVATFSTSRDSKSPGEGSEMTAGKARFPFIVRPPPAIFGQIVFSGKANTQVAPGSNLVVQDFVTGALKAVEVVTSSAVSGDADAIAAVLSDSCLSDLNSIAQRVPVEERKALLVRSEDVFFSFIVNGVKNEAGRHTVHFVTYSLQDLAAIRTEMKAIKDQIKALMSSISGNNVDEIAAKVREKTKADIALQRKFLDTDITISNAVLTETADEQWLVEHIALKRQSQVATKLATMRWKGRLRYTLSGREFLSILRFDYSTDLLMLVALVIMFLF